MTKSRIRRTGSGYEAFAAWVTRPGTGKPNGHSERCGVDPTGLREEGKSYLRRSRLWSVHTGLPRQQCRGTEAEKSAEAIVAQPGEGLNLLMKEQMGTFDERVAAERRPAPRQRSDGRNSLFAAWTAASVHGRRPITSLDDSHHWIRYNIRRNRRIRQVRTVVWEDGAARPLLPDRRAPSPPIAPPESGGLRGRRRPRAKPGARPGAHKR
jgi:hypothetical protein